MRSIVCLLTLLAPAPTAHISHTHLTLSYWKGSLPEAELLATCRRVEADAWRLQREAGVTRVGLDGTLYDQVQYVVRCFRQ